MPTVMRFDGIRVAIYTNDHRPPHVRVLGAGKEAVFLLNAPTGPPTLRGNLGFTTSELNQIALDNGLELAFPPRMAEGLEHATPAELVDIEISPSGDGLHWPAIDADLYIPSLLRGMFGSKTWMARQLGAAGGRAESPTKAAAAKENGRKGGRPRKVAEA